MTGRSTVVQMGGQPTRHSYATGRSTRSRRGGCGTGQGLHVTFVAKPAAARSGAPRGAHGDGDRGVGSAGCDGGREDEAIRAKIKVLGDLHLPLYFRGERMIFGDHEK